MDENGEVFALELQCFSGFQLDPMLSVFVIWLETPM